jgi:hypothetical protein
MQKHMTTTTQKHNIPNLCEVTVKASSLNAAEMVMSSVIVENKMELKVGRCRAIGTLVAAKSQSLAAQGSGE